MRIYFNKEYVVFTLSSSSSEPMVKYAYPIFFLLFCSCATKKQLTYLRKDQVPEHTPNFQAYTIQPGDNLFIEIKSTDVSSSNFYNLNNSSSGSAYNEAYIFLNSYSVNEAGKVLLPHLGEIKVSDLSVEQISQTINEALTDHLKNASVYVKMVSYKVTVLGEVQNPGTYEVHRNGQINIFEALGLGGDMTNYARRKSVKVIRNEENGRSREIEIDLTSKLCFASEAYTIYPHDVIYVEPARIRATEMNVKPLGILLSFAAVVLLMLRTIN